MQGYGWVAALVLIGCGESADDPLGTPLGDQAEDAGPEYQEPPPSACGAAHYVDMEIVGQVRGPGGAPMAGAEVWLEERTWRPTTVHGEGITDADGWFSFHVANVPIVEDCFAIGPQFYAVADASEAAGEVTANMQVVNAWLDGTMVADLSNLNFVVD